ncbi:MAG TPA: alpha/beta fold hydrolase [Candidatus Binatia bacterium]|nr:alpha/beta fold hydrolase [Candidatus Binatia bacterium]
MEASRRRERLRFVEVDVGDVQERPARVAFREFGEGPPLVLVHGLGTSSSVWHLVAPLLARRWRVLAVDLPGSGLSPPTTEVDGTWHARLLCRFAEQAAGEPSALVGHSLAGGLAMLAALEDPDLFTSVSVVAPGGLGRELALWPRVQSLAAVSALAGLLTPTLFRLVGPHRMERVLRYLFARGDEGRAARPLLREACHAFSKPAAVRSYCRTLREVASIRGQRPRYQLLSRLGDLQVPVLVVWGATDRVLPVAHGRRAAAAYPDLEFQVIPECGHTPQLECPEQLAELIEEFAGRGATVPRTATA